jgi:hypothetical protein
MNQTADPMNPYKALETLAVLALACLAAGLFFDVQALLVAALILLFAGLFLKRLSMRIAEIWLRFAGLIGAVNSRIILTLIFYMVLTPLALVYRLFHGDFMKIRRLDDPGRSYWSRRDHQYNPRDLGNVW